MERVYQRGIISLKDTLDFGEHKGSYLFQVIDYFPSYILWCLDTIYGFEIDKEADARLKNSINH